MYPSSLISYHFPKNTKEHRAVLPCHLFSDHAACCSFPFLSLHYSPTWAYLLIPSTLFESHLFHVPSLDIPPMLPATSPWIRRGQSGAEYECHPRSEGPCANANQVTFLPRGCNLWMGIPALPGLLPKAAMSDTRENTLRKVYWKWKLLHTFYTIVTLL